MLAWVLTSNTSAATQGARTLFDCQLGARHFAAVAPSSCGQTEGARMQHVMGWLWGDEADAQEGSS